MSFCMVCCAVTRGWPSTLCSPPVTRSFSGQRGDHTCVPGPRGEDLETLADSGCDLFSVSFALVTSSHFSLLLQRIFSLKKLLLPMVSSGSLHLRGTLLVEPAPDVAWISFLGGLCHCLRPLSFFPLALQNFPVLTFLCFSPIGNHWD